MVSRFRRDLAGLKGLIGQESACFWHFCLTSYNGHRSVSRSSRLSQGAYCRFRSQVALGRSVSVSTHIAVTGIRFYPAKGPSLEFGRACSVGCRPHRRKAAYPRSGCFWLRRRFAREIAVNQKRNLCGLGQAAFLLSASRLMSHICILIVLFLISYPRYFILLVLV